MFNPFSPYQEAGFNAWKQGIEALPPLEVSIRQAEKMEQDGRWIRWMQTVCESTPIHSVEDNVSKIGQQLVLLAEIADYPVGFCRVLVGRTTSEPLFIQSITVVPFARRRGVGVSLLRAAAEREPQRSIAMATLDDNVAARRLNERFAESIGGTIQRVPLRRYRPSDLGFVRGERHRPWVIVRQREAD